MDLSTVPDAGVRVGRLTGRVLLLMLVVWGRRSSAAMPPRAATWRSRQDRGLSRETQRPRRVSARTAGLQRTLPLTLHTTCERGCVFLENPPRLSSVLYCTRMALPRERVVVCDNGSGVRGPATHCTVPATTRRRSSPPRRSPPGPHVSSRRRLYGGWVGTGQLLCRRLRGPCACACACVCRVCGTGLPSTGNAICNLSGGQELLYGQVL